MLTKFWPNMSIGPNSTLIVTTTSPSTTQLQVLRLGLRASTLVGKSRKNKNGKVISFRDILRETIDNFHNQSNQ